MADKEILMDVKDLVTRFYTEHEEGEAHDHVGEVVDDLVDDTAVIP